MSLVGTAVHPELAFVLSDCEPRPPEPLQHVADVTDVVLPSGAVNDDVIQVCCCIARTIHQELILECRGQPEWHHLKLEKFVRGGEGGSGP